MQYLFSNAAPDVGTVYGCVYRALRARHEMHANRRKLAQPGKSDAMTMLYAKSVLHWRERQYVWLAHARIAKRT